uniref:Mitochondrial carrier protein n=1 Tax=Zooxanthella nutricula TaxID=1333877 RepID=A0A7S2LZ41_9DINO|eukprot:CAMPEP_0198589758 /NCGR_PEP_ID=MMETSP1462-20131121/134791_1 /TAXON_ID=1333877 /ORGANISM="Brandtodinium nutriculum, Strain RCC3387" /LENGTH=317 /DNA_ID=CAMNT_0044321281 /DNA_START=1 /DNA_END=954 /DNA_ORIENTATION=+
MVAAPARNTEDLPFPRTIGYWALAANGAKGGGTKYLTLQYLNFARWTAQQHSCNLPQAIKIMARNYVFHADGRFTPLGFFKMWWPYVTLMNETVHWGMKVPLAMCLYDKSREVGLGQHSGLFVGVALSSAGEVVATGWSERFGVHMGLRQLSSYKESLRLSQEARGNIVAAAYAGAGGLWLRNFAWNFAFFEWKRFFHNAVEETPAGAPSWFCWHLDWLRTLDKKDQANFLTFEAATLGTYLTFFNMAGDNIKTKMQHDPARYPNFRDTCLEIWGKHGLLGFARGGLFKGIYLILGATVAIGIQERLSEIMAALMHR